MHVISKRKDVPRSHYSAVRDVANEFDYFIVDLWGVIFDGSRPFPQAFEALRELRARNKRVIFLSNTARRAAQVALLLQELGLERDAYAGIVTAGEATYRALVAHNIPGLHRGDRYLRLGEQEGDDWWLSLPFAPVPSVADAQFLLAVGEVPDGPHSAGELSAVLHSAVEQRLPLICANPDLEFVTQGRTRVAVGSIAATYRSLGGPTFQFGKPDASIYATCLSELGDIPPAKVAAFGDSLATDVAGASQMGIVTILVTDTGVHATLFAESTRNVSLITLSKIYDVLPDATIPAFAW